MSDLRKWETEDQNEDDHEQAVFFPRMTLKMVEEQCNRESPKYLCQPEVRRLKIEVMLVMDNASCSWDDLKMTKQRFSGGVLRAASKYLQKASRCDLVTPLVQEVFEEERNMQKAMKFIMRV